jgi:hypothetical protein
LGLSTFKSIPPKNLQHPIDRSHIGRQNISGLYFGKCWATILTGNEAETIHGAAA